MLTWWLFVWIINANAAAANIITQTEKDYEALGIRISLA